MDPPSINVRWRSLMSLTTSSSLSVRTARQSFCGFQLQQRINLSKVAGVTSRAGIEYVLLLLISSQVNCNALIINCMHPESKEKEQQNSETFEK